MIHYRYFPRSSIRWLYLRHRFIVTYLSRHPLPDTHTELQPPQNLVDSIEQFSGKLSIILDNALLDFSAAMTRLDNTIHAIENALDDDVHPFFHILDHVHNDDIFLFFYVSQNQILISSLAYCPGRLGYSDISLFTANIPSNNQLL